MFPTYPGRLIVVAAFAMSLARLGAQEVERLSFDFSGMIQADPRASEPLRGFKRGLRIAWRVPHGHLAHAGEAIIAFDCSKIREELVEKELSLLVDRSQLAKQELQLQGQIDDLLHQRQLLIRRLTRAGKARDAAGTHDQDRLRLLEAEYRQARQRHREAVENLEEQTQAYSEGRISRAQLRATRTRARDLEVAADNARARWEETMALDLSLAVEQRELEQERLEVELGAEDAASVSGLAAEIAATRDRIERELTNRRSHIENQQRELDELAATATLRSGVERLDEPLVDRDRQLRLRHRVIPP